MNDPLHSAERLEQLISAMLEERLSAEQVAELRLLLRSSAEARRQYVQQITAHAMLQWINAPLGIAAATGSEPQDAGEETSAVAANSVPLAAAPSWLVPFHVPLTSMPVLGAYGLVAIIVTTLLVGLGRLPGAGTSPSPTGTARIESISPSPAAGAKLAGRITGLVDCRWLDPAMNRADFGPVAQGQTCDLASGLLEITHQSGAKVILQGPCTYRVDSVNGGFLSSGKLTATAEKERKGFVIRTPIATLTAEDGEFGVEVERPDISRSYVFRGQVALRFVGDHGMEPEERVLSQHDYARIEELGRSVAATVMRGVGCPDAFARSIPGAQPPGRTVNPPPLDLVGNERHLGFQPVRTIPIDPGTLAQHTAGSPWSIQSVALTSGSPRAVNGATHTVRVTFELTENIRLGDTELVGQYVTENRVKAMRFNGKVLPRGPTRLPDHVGRHSGRFHLMEHFVQGTNVLEIDIEQRSSTGSPEDKLMELRMEIHAARKPSAASSNSPVDTNEQPKQSNPTTLPAKGGYSHELM
jgi:hypothetical protein